MMIEKHQNTKRILNLANIKRHIIFAVACLLVFMPVSLSSQSAGPANGEPDFRNVTLWDYNVDMRANYDYFWTATNPSKYIMPGNPIIRYYANNTQEIQIDYAPDNVDYWQNPDYTLKIMRGDCEDETFVWVSIHRAKGHKAIAVGGYIYFDDGTSVRDIWYEYVDNNTRQIKFVTPVVSVRKFYSKPLFMFNDAMGIRDYDPDWMNKD
ncbi:MAG: hypothetical protein OIN66_16665 [Candidatus Methanoperedens sp.]|nr:hypothetical protein [Candidatus Methanoperedens sp.]